MSDQEHAPRLIRWRVLCVVWVLLWLPAVVPHYQDGELSNLSPVAFAYLAWLVAPSEASATVVLVIGCHLAATLLTTVLLGLLRRRVGEKRYKVVMACTVAAIITGGAVAVHECWPDGIFFDASNVYYDVSDLVRSPAAPDAPFADAAAVAGRLHERTANAHKHYLPCAVMPCSNEPTIIAWGSWPEHYHLRQQLAAIRRE